MQLRNALNVLSPSLKNLKISQSVKAKIITNRYIRNSWRCQTPTTCTVASTLNVNTHTQKLLSCNITFWDFAILVKHIKAKYQEYICFVT